MEPASPSSGHAYMEQHVTLLWKLLEEIMDTDHSLSSYITHKVHNQG